MSGHETATPRPWAVHARLDEDQGTLVYHRPKFADDRHVCDCAFGSSRGAEENAANAALIVEAVNSFEALTAERDALKAENERLRERVEEQAEKLSGCPFARPDYELPLDMPCPVCGALGTHDSPNNCLYPSKASRR